MLFSLQGHIVFLSDLKIFRSDQMSAIYARKALFTCVEYFSTDMTQVLLILKQ